MSMTTQELNETLIDLLNEGRLIVVRCDDGELKFYAPEHQANIQRSETRLSHSEALRMLSSHNN